MILPLLLLCGAPACVSFQTDLRSQLTPGLRDESRVHAWQAASFMHTFVDSNQQSWEARLVAAERDLPPFYDALARSAYRADFEIVPHEHRSGSSSYEHYGVNLVLAPRSGNGERFVLPGDPGTDPEVYDRALASAAKRAKVDADVLKRGHFALFTLATMSGTLNATEDAMARYAFGLLVLRDKFSRKVQGADAFAPTRPPERSLEDVALALRVVADHHAAASRLRGEVLAVMALARAADVADARAAMLEQIVESRKHATDWRRTHPQPTQEAFGVAMRTLTLPTPDAMLAMLDKDGYIAAAVQVAKSVSTGDVAGTIEGFGKLAPPSSSLRVASEGTVAALRGDVAGAANAILALAENHEDLALAAARVRGIERAVKQARHPLSAGAAAAR